MFERFGDSSSHSMSNFSASKTGQAYLAIREQILAGRLRPHHNISFAQVAEVLETSGNIVRDAAFRLAGHGYLPNRTTHALVPHNWDRDWIDGWAEMREMLLVVAVRRVARQPNSNLDFLKSLIDFRIPYHSIDPVVAEEFIIRSRFFCEAVIGLSGIRDSAKIYQSIYSSALHRMSVRAATCSELNTVWMHLDFAYDHLTYGLPDNAAYQITKYAKLTTQFLQRHLRQIEETPARYNVTFESMEAQYHVQQRGNVFRDPLPRFGRGLVDFASFNDYLTAKQLGNIGQ